MVSSSGVASISTTLSRWLRLLWDIAPPLRLDSEAPYIAAGAIHLPAQNHWWQHRAAAAHAAAHLAYSPRAFDGDGAGPITRALMAMLEDARVELLAIRALPGLARLWRPLHEATPALGSNFEALMQRLARSLADPAYDDPDRWVRKGVTLFYADSDRSLPALLTAVDVRNAAMRLGHDIGQMRLQFNAKSYRPSPSYRDDSRWMWTADVVSAVPPPAGAAGDADAEDESPPDASVHFARYPEWDRLISRLRPEWCNVIDQQARRTSTVPPVAGDAIRRTATGLRKPLRALARDAVAPQRGDEGDVFDLGALVDRHVARRLRNICETRVYRVTTRLAAPAAVYLLVDQSASTSDSHNADGHSVIQTAAAAACAVAAALHDAGVRCIVAGFSSHGRHAVRVNTVKAFEDSADNSMIARLHALRPGGSTRLGAAIRHASASLAEHRIGPRWVIVLSDGEPHDVDVHDPLYLIEDARNAVLAAARNGVRAVCLVMASDRAASARRIFGRPGVQRLRDARDLARALPRLLG